MDADVGGDGGASEFGLAISDQPSFGAKFLLSLSDHGGVDQLGLLQGDGNVGKRRAAGAKLHDAVGTQVVLRSEMGEIHECDPVQVARADGRVLCAKYELVALQIVEVVGGDATIVIELIAAQAIQAVLVWRSAEQAGISILRFCGDGEACAGRVGNGGVVGSLDAALNWFDVTRSGLSGVVGDGSSGRRPGARLMSKRRIASMAVLEALFDSVGECGGFCRVLGAGRPNDDRKAGSRGRKRG